MSKREMLLNFLVGRPKSIREIQYQLFDMHDDMSHEAKRCIKANASSMIKRLRKDGYHIEYDYESKAYNFCGKLNEHEDKPKWLQ